MAAQFGVHGVFPIWETDAIFWRGGTDVKPRSTLSSGTVGAFGRSFPLIWSPHGWQPAVNKGGTSVRLPQDHDPLAIGDALFLHLERDGMPLNVALVGILDGMIDLPSFIAYVESKLPLIPRYLQRVVTPPLFAGLPVWEYDREFDIRNHVHEIHLRSGSEREFKDAAANVLSQLMRRDRPLWDLTLIRGLSRSRTGLITRVHHCLADGISGVGLLKVMAEDTPRTFSPPKRKPRLLFPPRRDPATALFDAVVNTAFTTVERVLSMESELLEVAHRFAARNAIHPDSTTPPIADVTATSLDELRRLLPELASPAQRLPFNVVCRGPQKFDWTSIPLDELKALKRQGDATTNDVILTLLTLAIQRYLRLHRVPIRRRTLRVVVPVNVRGNGSAVELGNRITFVPVTVPLDIARPTRLLAIVHEKTSLLKTTHLAEIVATAGGLLTTVPTGVQALLGPIVSQLPLSVCNLICTNVPGPQLPLYLLGHKLLGCYPYVPIGGEMGMNCAVISYDGGMFFGFTGDAGAIPDLHMLPRLLQQSFKAFQQDAGIRTPRRRQSPPRPTATLHVPDDLTRDSEVRAPQPAEAEPQEVLRAAAGS
jgi:diacylglycerol O-acyltransferase / wax synthase